MASSLAARRLLSRAAAARRLPVPFASAPAPAMAPRRFSADAGPPPPLPPPPLEPVVEPPTSEGAGTSSSSTTAGAGAAHRSSPGAAAGARRLGGAGYEEEQEKVLRASLLHVPRMGWSESAMVTGARDVGVSPAIVGAFPRKEAALVEAPAPSTIPSTASLGVASTHTVQPALTTGVVVPTSYVDAPPDHKFSIISTSGGRSPKFSRLDELDVAPPTTPAISSVLSSVLVLLDRPSVLVECYILKFFMDDCLQQLMDRIDAGEGEQLKNLILSERLSKLVRMRLEMQAPYISKWPQALSIQSQPANVSTSLKQRAVLVDEIWHAAGDSGSDIDWYVKRTVLGGIYSTSEVYMLTDNSPEFRDTWTFVNRRIKDALDLQKTFQEAAYLAEAVGAGMGGTVQGVFNRVFQKRSG